MTIRVFVSYRRSDNRHATGRLREHLARAFGRENVFYDVDSLAFGADFRQVINTTLQNVDALVLVIGPNFDVPRLAQENDYIRMELQEAFELDTTVVPVLVDDARMPTPAELPPVLEQLSYRTAAPLRPDPDFEHDTERLVEDLRRNMLRRPPAPSTMPARGPPIPPPAPSPAPAQPRLEPTVVTPVAVPETAVPTQSGRRRRVAAVAALGLAVAAAALLLVLTRSRDESASSVTTGATAVTTAPTSVQPATTTAAPAAVPSVAPASATATTTSTTTRSTAPTTTVPPSPAPPPTIVATVTYTCGSSGRGDCYLSLRAAPNSNSQELGRLNEGVTVDIECQVPGETVTGSLAGSGNVWARTPDGRYLANIYLEAPSIDRFRITMPCPA